MTRFIPKATVAAPYSGLDAARTVLRLRDAAILFLNAAAPY
jgi:hypothetical protein